MVDNKDKDHKRGGDKLDRNAFEREITTDLDLYMDIYHFAPQVNRWTIDRTCAGLDQVDAAGAADAEQRLRAALAQWRPPAAAPR